MHNLRTDRLSTPRRDRLGRMAGRQHIALIVHVGDRTRRTSRRLLLSPFWDCPVVRPVATGSPPRDGFWVAPDEFRWESTKHFTGHSTGPANPMIATVSPDISLNPVG